MTDSAVVAPDPVDWVTARKVARLVAGRDAVSSSYLGASLEADLAGVTTEAEQLVAELTGLSAPGRATARVLDRPSWVEANVDSMRRMIEPLTRRVGERLARSPLAPVGRHVTGTEMGLLLGYLSQRVLGQYDLLVPDEPGGPGGPGDAVYYVGPNVLTLEKRFAFRPREFRRWIALHELTHRAQFTGVPWMRDHFLSLVRQSFEVADPDPRRLFAAIGRAADELRAGRNPLDEGGLVGLLASPEQRTVLEQVQALMALLEGHGNVVMNELGRRHVVGEERMERVLNARRERRGLSGQFQKLLGFEMKMRQYALGEAFVRGVERQAGLGALDTAWSEPEALPTLPELSEPGRWLARVGGTSVARGAGRSR